MRNTQLKEQEDLTTHDELRLQERFTLLHGLLETFDLFMAVVTDPNHALRDDTRMFAVMDHTKRQLSQLEQDVSEFVRQHSVGSSSTQHSS